MTWTVEPATHVIDVNALAFGETEETFGISRIPKSIQSAYDFNAPLVATSSSADMLQPSPGSIYPTSLQLSSLSGKHKDIYSYLSVAQNTRFPVVPLHTQEEFKMFNDVVSVGGEFAPIGKSPNFEVMAIWWSGIADGVKIHYKLPEHLASHFKKWEQQ